MPTEEDEKRFLHKLRVESPEVADAIETLSYLFDHGEDRKGHKIEGFRFLLMVGGKEDKLVLGGMMNCDMDFLQYAEYEIKKTMVEAIAKRLQEKLS